MELREYLEGEFTPSLKIDGFEKKSFKAMVSFGIEICKKSAKFTIKSNVKRRFEKIKK